MARVFVACLILLVWTGTAFATPDDVFGKSLVRKIKREGYTIVSVRTTLLRRVQIDSENSSNRRQTVYNPVTKVLLQDRIIPLGESTLMSAVSDLLGIGGGDGDGDKPGKGKGKNNDNGNSGNNGNGNGNSGSNGNGNSGNGNGNGKGNKSE